MTSSSRGDLAHRKKIDVPASSGGDHSDTLLSFDWVPPGGSLEIDLGCHRGVFVVAMAQLHPSIHFLGVERQRHRVERCLEKITRRALPNAHVVQGEGLRALRALPASCANVIHVSFPDPWPKRRHHSRRLVKDEFLRAAWRSLGEEGSLRLMTDDESYFLAMTEAASGFDGFMIIPWDDGREYPETEFQRKFTAVAKPIYRLALRRCSSMRSA